MALPSTRNTTYAAGAQVKSDDLNAIQDNIINANYKEQETPFHASSFMRGGNVGSLTTDIWIGDGASGFSMMTGIQIPVGSRITRVKFGYDRKGAGTVTLQLRRKSRTTGGAAGAAVATYADVVSASGAHDHELVINHTVETGYLYQLVMSFDAVCDTANGLGVGASVFHDRL